MNSQDKAIQFLINWKSPKYPTRKQIQMALQIKDSDSVLNRLQNKGLIKINEVFGNGEDDYITLINESYFYDKRMKRLKSVTTYILGIFAAVISGYILYRLTKKL